METRIAVMPDWTCGGLALIEPYCPGLFVVTSCAMGSGGIDTVSRDFNFELDHSGSMPDTNTGYAFNPHLTADLETRSQPPQWVRGVRLMIHTKAPGYWLLSSIAHTLLLPLRRLCGHGASGSISADISLSHFITYKPT